MNWGRGPNHTRSMTMLGCIALIVRLGTQGSCGKNSSYLWSTHRVSIIQRASFAKFEEKTAMLINCHWKYVLYLVWYPIFCLDNCHNYSNLLIPCKYWIVLVYNHLSTSQVIKIIFIFNLLQNSELLCLHTHFKTIYKTFWFINI